MNSNREDYILTIYRLKKERGKVHNIDIARKLEVSRASVSEMVKKLNEDGLVSMEDNRIFLTDEGMRKAQDILSIHRLWELFLIEHLNIAVDRAHYHADLLEHATDEALMHALNRYLDYPVKSVNGKSIYINDTTNDNLE